MHVARKRIKDFSRSFVLLTVIALLLTRSSIPLSDNTERIRFYTRNIEFNYVDWTIKAFWIKIKQSSLGLNRYLSDAQAAEIVLDSVEMTRRIQENEAEVRNIYSDPEILDKVQATRELDAQLTRDYALRNQLGPLAEAIIQDQVLEVLEALGIAAGGESFPPVLYNLTPIPKALIISPRDIIRKDNQISISPTMTIDEQIVLENRVTEGLNVSSLVDNIAGVGVYPAMVVQTSDINWLAEVVSHEWSHHFFFLRPLGVYYLNSAAMRTINETAASIIGKEIGAVLIEKYYPDFAPTPPAPPADDLEDLAETEESPPSPPVFDFRAEMRETRVNADRLLQEGQIERAEFYMEFRRLYFWDNGYRIRKLNQAYFAFRGAYADLPGGAAGDDPVAAAVRELRAQSASLSDFMNTISWMRSFEDLETYLASNSN